MSRSALTLSTRPLCVLSFMVFVLSAVSLIIELSVLYVLRRYLGV
jgi:hypothetical protein